MKSDKVLEIFREITTVPRESGHEEQIGAYLKAYAQKLGLPCKMDEAGNVLITKPAAPGKENVPTLVLQAHQDMVCEKTSASRHNFDTDPISFEIEDGWMIARETTLGADDGIGIAACLALLESDVPCGPLECLFTTSEETSMEGAEAMQEGFFSGKTLINLDSEDEGQLFVGCAGGLNTNAMFTYSPVPVRPGNKSLKLRVFGGQGGHSGDDINKGRANAVQLLARFLYGVMDRNWQLQLFKGGNKHNAIAREAEAIIALPASGVKMMVELFEQFGRDIAAEYHVTEPALACEAVTMDYNEKAVDEAVKYDFISALVAVHHGVLAMSQDIEGLVETSSNLASVRMNTPCLIEVCTSQRSSVESAKAAIADKVEACLRLAGAKTERAFEYPGWTPNMNSPILAQTVKAYRELFGADPEVKAIHAGLECGLFLQKVPGLDMISFGPTLRGVHAPGERLDLASNEKFVKLLEAVVSGFGA